MSMREDRLRLIEEHGIRLVLDVGGNAGQYATGLREAGYRGPILSFEPLHEAYGKIATAASSDPDWETINVALADRPGTKTIHVSANSFSSSFFPTITDRCVAAAPEAAYVGTEVVDVTTLDAVTLPPGNLMLKMDTQGTEPDVLRGAHEVLKRVLVIEVELSLVELYEGQDLSDAVCRLLRTLGFVPVSVDSAFADPATGELLSLDVLFVRVDPGVDGGVPARAD
jgi:FkbM family methyltransferase